MNHIYQGDQPVPYIPYTYIIGWRKLKTYYYGCETSNKKKIANPANLWTVYYTSSPIVKEFRKLHGDPDIISIHRTFQTAQEAIMFEHQYLTKINAQARDNWLNRHNGRDNFITTGMRWITDGKKERVINPHEQVPEGWYYGHSPNHQPNRKFSRDASLKAIQAHKGKTIINNGMIQKFHDPQKPLPANFSIGQLPENIIKAQTAAKGKRVMTQRLRDIASVTHRGKVVSTNTRQKQSIAHTGSRWINNGKETVKLPKGGQLPEGYVYGRIMFKRT